MIDLGAVVVGAVLFLFLQPGLVIQFPGETNWIEFSGLRTSSKAIVVHALIFFVLYSLLVMVVHLQVFPGKVKRY